MQAEDAEIRKVFLSYNFGDTGRELAEAVRDVLRRKHGVDVVTGRRLGGAELGTIKQLIQDADCLVALMTRRHQIGEHFDGVWDSHPWIRDELFYAYVIGKPAIALVETGVEFGGLLADHEYIALDRKRLQIGLDALSKTVEVWTGAIGANPIDVFIRPDEVADWAIKRDIRWTSQWLSQGTGETGEWKEMQAYFVPGGLMGRAPRPPEDGMLLRVQALEEGKVVWSSRFTAQTVLITMDREPGDEG